LMWNKNIDIIYEPHCDDMPDDLKVFVPVCRDELRAKIERIAKWRMENYEFEKISVKECYVCRR